MLWKITVQQRGNSNDFGAGESLGSPLLICTSVVTIWHLIFFVLNLWKSPLFPRRLLQPKLCHQSAPSHSCWHTEAELLTDVRNVHGFLQEVGRAFPGDVGVLGWPFPCLPAPWCWLTERAVTCTLGIKLPLWILLTKWWSFHIRDVLVSDYETPF